MSAQGDHGLGQGEGEHVQAAAGREQAHRAVRHHDVRARHHLDDHRAQHVADHGADDGEHGDHGHQALQPDTEVTEPPGARQARQLR